MRINAPTEVMTQAYAGEKTKPGLRTDFQQSLESRIRGMLGKEGTDRREKMEKVFDSLLGPEDDQGKRKVELGQLPDRQKHNLLRLQEKSEDLEALFVKMMLKDLQKANPIGGQGQMAGLARDFMNDAIAKATTQQGEGLGIARTVFLDIAENDIQTIVGQRLADATKQENDN